MRSQIFELDADIKHSENRQGSKYKRHGIYYTPLVLLQRVLDLGAVITLPPSLLLGHDSSRGWRP